MCTLQESKSNYSRSQLFCIRFLYDSATMEKLGVLLFAIDPDELSHTFSDVADGGLILGRDGIIYSSAGQYTVGNVYQDDSRGELFKTESGTRTLSYKNRYGRTVMLSCRSVLDGDGLLVIPFNDYTGISRSEMNQYIISVCALLIASAAIALAASIKLSGSLSRSIQNLTGTMKRIDGGEIDLRCSTAGVDEIAFLSEKINNMLDSLVAAQRVRETDLRAAQNLELRLMQSQINPHFLFNVLTSISLEAKLDGSEELYQMTHALAQLLQGKIFRQDSIKIPLREELEIVRYYLYLQGRRFADWLSYRCECEDEPLLDCLVPRLCVEPLVENAVVHGIEPKAAPGEIRVLVRREGEALLIEVNDDGVGFRAGSESGKRHSHVGLHNIERLVANLYGEGYGLTIESAENRGTRVLLRLPVEEG